MSNITVDVSELKAFSLFLKGVEVSLQREFLKSLNTAGEVVAKKAKANASFSHKIPQTIKVRRRGTRVNVIAGGAKAPDAVPLEHGGQSGTFRHPVFGSPTTPWEEQPAHPFLVPAGIESQPEVMSALVHAVDAAWVKVRL